MMSPTVLHAEALALSKELDQQMDQQIINSTVASVSTSNQAQQAINQIIFNNPGSVLRAPLVADGAVVTPLTPVAGLNKWTVDTDSEGTSLKVIPRSVEVSTLKMLYVYGMMAKPVCAYCKKKYDGWNDNNVTGEELAKHLKEDGWTGICESGYFNPREQGIPSGIFLACPECARQKQEECVAGGTLLAIWKL